MEKMQKKPTAAKISGDESLEYAESIINTVREPLIALNQDLRVVIASRSFYEVFKVNHFERFEAAFAVNRRSGGDVRVTGSGIP
jgi:hypothetical protein